MTHNTPSVMGIRRLDLILVLMLCLVLSAIWPPVHAHAATDTGEKIIVTDPRWGVVCDSDGRTGNGTNNTAALQTLSTLVRSGQSIYFPACPPGKYYRISGAGATIASPIYALFLKSSSNVEIFGAGAASRIFLDNWTDTEFDTGLIANAGNHGAYAAICLYLSHDVSIHDLAFYGLYGTREKFPTNYYYVRSSGIKVLQSNRVSIDRVYGYNILGNVVTIQALSATALSEDVAVRDSYFENSAESDVNWMSGRRGMVANNTSKNSIALVESGADHTVVVGNRISLTAEYAHTTSSGGPLARGITIKGESSIVMGNTLTDDSFLGFIPLEVSGQSRNNEATVNGSFADGRGWTLGTGWAVVGKLAHTAGNATDARYNPTGTDFVPTKGETYQIAMRLVVETPGTLSMSLCGNTYTLATSASTRGTYSVTIHPDAGTTDTAWKFTSDARFAGSISNLTIAWMHMNGRNSVITGNTIRGYAGSGVGLVRVATPASGVIISNNTFSNLSNDPTQNRYAIYVAGVNNAGNGLMPGNSITPIQRIRIEGNSINAPKIKHGIYIDHIENSAIINNTVRVAGYGLYAPLNHAERIDIASNDLAAANAIGVYTPSRPPATWRIASSRGPGIASGTVPVVSKAWDPGNIAPGASTTTTVTVSGAQVGQRVAIWFDKNLLGCSLTAQVNAAGSVTAILTNNTGSDKDVVSGTLYVRVGQ
jgi:hypothetical protein